MLNKENERKKQKKEIGRRYRGERKELRVKLGRERGSAGGGSRPGGGALAVDEEKPGPGHPAPPVAPSGAPPRARIGEQKREAPLPSPSRAPCSSTATAPSMPYGCSIQAGAPFRHHLGSDSGKDSG